MGDKIFVADKETLDKVYNILSAEPVYGFIEHNSVLDPTKRIEYIGANKDYTPISITMGGSYTLNSWVDFPILKGNKPYMVKSDGTPDYRLDESDYTKKEDGTASDVSNTSYDGGAFSWLPKIYKREYMAGDDRVVLFRFEKAEGYEAVGFIDTDDKELEGVWIPMFYGSVVDGKMKSIAGTQPVASLQTSAEKTAIDAFGSRAKFLGGPIANTINDLLVMFAKTTNLQAAYGSGNCSGYVNDSAQAYGVKQNVVVGGGKFYGTNDGKTLNKIFHSIVLGSYQQWMRDPYTVCVNGVVKVSKNYAYDLTGAAYSPAGINFKETASGVYPHRFRAVAGFGAIPETPYKGTSELGGCDGFWVNPGITAVARRFGDCGSGAVCGGRALRLHDAATDAHWHIGAAVLLLPPVGAAA